MGDGSVVGDVEGILVYAARGVDFEDGGFNFIELGGGASY